MTPAALCGSPLRFIEFAPGKLLVLIGITVSRSKSGRPTSAWRRVKPAQASPNPASSPLSIRRRDAHRKLLDPGARDPKPIPAHRHSGLADHAPEPGRRWPEAGVKFWG